MLVVQYGKNYEVESLRSQYYLEYEQRRHQLELNLGYLSLPGDLTTMELGHIDVYHELQRLERANPGYTQQFDAKHATESEQL